MGAPWIRPLAPVVLISPRHVVASEPRSVGGVFPIADAAETFRDSAAVFVICWSGSRILKSN